MTIIEETFVFASWTPAPSPESERLLLSVEKRLNTALPSVFRELIALKNGPALLRHFSNADEPIPATRLAMPLARWPGYDPRDDNLLPFMMENQAVCVWAIRLDGGEDPPVVVEVDSGTPPRWQECADRFSSWLKCQVQDHGLLESCWLAAQAAPLGTETLRMLRDRFEEGPRTHGWPGKTNYRFCNARSRLLLWDGGAQCDWWIQPTSAVLTAAALDEIRDIAGIEHELYALKDEHNEPLRRWRQAANDP